MKLLSPIRFHLLIALFIGSLAGTNAEDKPNILFIIADDLSAEAIGAYGNDVCATPNLDRLASEGVLFDRAYCQYPVCGASRASFMSGLYPETTGFLGNNYAFGSYRAFNPKFAAHPSIGGFLRRNGYVSARVSKIYHMGVPGGIEAGEPGGDDPDSWDLAFDVWAPETGSIGEFSNYSPARSHWGSAFVAIEVPDGASATQADEMTVTQAISILETRTYHRNETNRMKPGEPLFLGVGLVRPHVPLVAPERYFRMYDKGNVTLPYVPENDFADVPKPNQNKSNEGKGGYGMTEEQSIKSLEAYYASVTYMDDQLGRLLDALERMEIADNTIVVFISDHGWLLGEHNSWQKPSMFEPACRVPLIVRAPGFEKNAGKTSSQLVELIDLYPTFAELVGLGDKTPAALQGHSITPLLEKPNREDWVRPASYSVMGNKTAVERTSRSENFRYSLYSTDEEELYDHIKDPNEFTNQASNPEYATIKKQLREQLEARSAAAVAAGK